MLAPSKLSGLLWQEAEIVAIETEKTLWWVGVVVCFGERDCNE